jgi:hypothetical protein
MMEDRSDALLVGRFYCIRRNLYRIDNRVGPGSWRRACAPRRQIEYLGAGNAVSQL